MFKAPPKPPPKKACAFRMSVESYELLHELAKAYGSNTAICVQDLVMRYAPAAIAAAKKQKAARKAIREKAAAQKEAAETS